MILDTSGFPILSSISGLKSSKNISLSSLPVGVSTFGPNVSQLLVGSTTTSLSINAGSNGIVAQNNDINNGASFMYFSSWDFFKNSAISGWANGNCIYMNYWFNVTNIFMYGAICPFDTGVNVGGLSINVASSVMPSRWGSFIPGWGSFSTNTG